MLKRFCLHANPAGVACGAPPLKDRPYCYWHLEEAGRRFAAARTRARSERVTLKFPVLDDLHAVQASVTQVLEALAHRELDHRTAQLMLTGLRLAAANLKSDRGGHQKSDFHRFGAEPRMMAAHPEFESRYDLPPDFDLSVDPEVAFPPPAVPLTPGRGATANIPATATLGAEGVPPFEEFEWGEKMSELLREIAAAPRPVLSAEMVEIFDALEREGQPGVDKCLAGHERNRKRRERHARRVYCEQVARHESLKRAAEQLAEEQRKAASASNLEPKLSFDEQWDAINQRFSEDKGKRPQSATLGVENAQRAAGRAVGEA